MKLLVLGGTQFLGRSLVGAALARGHSVTLFNRGRTHPELFPGLEKLRGDRDGNLAALKNREWDAAIDTSGFASAKVRATAECLAHSVDHYTFISSISVYSDFSRSGLDEASPLARLPEGAVEDDRNGKTYGARKALCEEAARQSIPGRVLVVRPGIIAGPHDPTGRFTYWVQRVAKGGEVLAPGRKDAPVQLIDVRDLARWIVEMTEQRKAGVYNTTGPMITFPQILEACRAAAGSDARFAWVDESFLLEQGVVPFTHLPLWIPGKETSFAGHFAVDSRAAGRLGLVCRPLVETARDTLVWSRQPGTAAVPDGTGLEPGREQELLRKWQPPLKAD